MGVDDTGYSVLFYTAVVPELFILAESLRRAKNGHVALEYRISGTFVTSFLALCAACAALSVGNHCLKSRGICRKSLFKNGEE